MRLDRDDIGRMKISCTLIWAFRLAPVLLWLALSLDNLQFQNPVLTAFAEAIWHCSSAADVAIKLNEAASHSH